MRHLLLILIPFMVSCGSFSSTSETAVQTKKSERSMRAARLSNDIVLILEVHYPSILRKILSQHSLNVGDVLVLNEIGVSSENLIHVIKYTRSAYMLTTDEIVTMQLGGVPFEVINYMIES